MSLSWGLADDALNHLASISESMQGMRKSLVRMNKAIERNTEAMERFLDLMAEDDEDVDAER